MTEAALELVAEVAFTEAALELAAEVDLTEAEPELTETGVEDAPETEARVEEELLAVDLTDDAEEERVEEEPLAVDLTEDEEE